MKKSNILRNFTNIPRPKLSKSELSEPNQSQNAELNVPVSEIESNDKVVQNADAGPSVAKKSDVKRKSKELPEESKLVKWEPKNWQKTLENLRKMRQQYPAPVDEMGCEKCSDEIDEKMKRYHVLISLMLSSQTKDQVTHAAMQRLRNHGLTPENITKTDDAVLENLLNPVCFYRVSTTYVQYMLLNAKV